MKNSFISSGNAVVVALVLGGFLARPCVVHGQQTTSVSAVPGEGDGLSELAAPQAIERVATAAHLIQRGAVLTENDIVYVDRPTTGGASIGSSVGVGWVTRRLVNAGEVLRAPAVEPPIVLTANQTVDASWSDGTVRITVRGVVTRDAALGERVTIRMPDGRRLDAIVTGPGAVRIV